MPVYKFTANGKTIKVTGDTPPSESELDDIFKAAGVSTAEAKPPSNDFKILGVNIHVPPDEKPRLDSNIATVGGVGIAPEDALMVGMAAKGIAAATSAGGMVAGLKEAVKTANPVVKFEVSRRALKAVGVPDGVAEVIAFGVSGYRRGGKPPVLEGPTSEPGYPRAGSTPAPPPAPVEPPAHLDLSKRVQAGSLTQQQIGERLAAAKAQGMNAPAYEPATNPAEPVRVPLPQQPPKPVVQPPVVRPQATGTSMQPAAMPTPRAAAPVPEGPPEPSMAKPAAPSKSPQQILNEEAIAKRRAAYQESLKADAKPVLEDVEAGKMTAEQAAAELAKRWGTPSDAERRFPPNKSGLPSNPPTARKARGKVSDLADMPIEPPKPVEPVAPSQPETGKISSLQTETPSKPSGPPVGELWDLARNAGKRWESSWSSSSGADRAEGEVFKYVRDIYVDAAQGKDVDAAIAKANTEWRAYAEQNNAKINAAGKIQRGPSSGQSVIGHRFTSPDLLESKLIHVRNMIKQAAKNSQ